ncbi:hypothetical protein JJB07_08230 [Tumebacillus sp. ITR2]|uniref:Uncharacterized protein n=1 Tax=Tumebacillus amylolyticus TaxID=2801339 RepID=A0ABS1J8P5_9BACL|nr:hypothetical protein [Tumebacillus amylolyticus]MBL0386636.1 hypothetical protein [Tumebacillus amylolyticus]
MDLASILDKISLTVIGMIVLGIFSALSVVMMMGNVLRKGKYGGAWAALGGVCIVLAGGLLLLNKFAPTALAKSEEPQHTASQTNPTTTTAEPEKTSSTAQGGETGNTQGIGEFKGQGNAEGEDLGWLLTVMQALKDGQPIPQEYMAMLPDGGKSLATQQAASGQTQGISKPLATQLTAIARDQGKASPRATASNYVPQSPYSGGSGAATSTTGNGTSPAPAPSNSGTPTQEQQVPVNPTPTPTPTPNPTPKPTPQPTPTPTPTPTPPVQQPPAAGTLVDGGLLKSVLGSSKSDVQNFFRYNQSLGENGNVLSYYRGSMSVDVTISGGIATHVTLRFDRFNPPGQDRAYYETYMLGMAGMSQANATSRSGSTSTWSNVYSGASNISISIDLASNSGRVEANR